MLGAHRATDLIQLPERKYGRWPNMGAYFWRSQWGGSVSAPFYKLRREYTHKPNSATMPSLLTPQTAFREISLSSAFLFFSQPEPANRLGFDMLSLISCLIWMADQLEKGLWDGCKRSREEIWRCRKIPFRAESQSWGIRVGERGNSSGDRGMNLIESQWALIFM